MCCPDRVDLTLHDWQKTERQEYGKGIPIGNSHPGQGVHKIPDVRRPDKYKARKDYHRQTEEEDRSLLQPAICDGQWAKAVDRLAGVREEMEDHQEQAESEY